MMERVPNEAKIRERKISDFKEMHKTAIKSKARKEFILTVSHMIPNSEYSKEGLDSIGFKSLSHFIRDCAGLHLTAKEFMNLAFAFDRYVRKAYEVVNHLIQVDGWTELLEYVPAESLPQCGASIATHGGDRKSESAEPAKNKAPSNTKAYWLLRLERDSKDDPEVAQVYDQVKSGNITPSKAAVMLGWRQTTTTIKKDVPSAIKTLKKLFSPAELEQIREGLA